MTTPTRRDFFTYAVGATLVSALPVSAQNPSDPRDPKLMPLVVDLIGPMAFGFTTDQKVNVWLPKLDDIDKHDAGIVTPVSNIVLKQADYTITGPTPRSDAGKPTIYPTSGRTVYEAQVKKDAILGEDRHIRLTLPMPEDIVALNPVIARIYKTGAAEKGDYKFYAAGLRFLYDHAGAPTLTPLTPLTPGIGTIQFDPAPPEIELNMLIGYAPVNHHDPDRDDQIAHDVFVRLSKLFPGADLEIEFAEMRNPPKPCKTAFLRVNLIP